MYLAFDIGIKNLAYCLINYDKKEPKKYSIEDWGIINLTLTDSEGVTPLVAAVSQGNIEMVKQSIKIILTSGNI